MDGVFTMSEIKRGCTKSLNLFCLCFNARNHHVPLLSSLSPSLCPHHPPPPLFSFNHPHTPHIPKPTTIITTPHTSLHQKEKKGKENYLEDEQDLNIPSTLMCCCWLKKEKKKASQHHRYHFLLSETIVPSFSPNKGMVLYCLSLHSFWGIKRCGPIIN